MRHGNIEDYSKNIYFDNTIVTGYKGHDDAQLLLVMDTTLLYSYALLSTDSNISVYTIELFFI